MLGCGQIVTISKKGFGFIAYGDARDVFFHVSSMTPTENFDDLRVGDDVVFHIDNTGDRPKAIDVERVDLPT